MGIPLRSRSRPGTAAGSARVRARSVLPALLALAAAACTGSPAPPAAAPPTGGPTGGTATTATPGPTAASPAPAPSPAGPGAGTLRLAFAGDVHFERQLRARLDDPATALEPIAGVLSEADVAMVNLETAIATDGTRQPKRYTFRAPPAALDALAAAGVDVATMANNHAADFGAAGLRETFAALKDRAVTARGGGTGGAAALATARAGKDLAVVGVGPDARVAYAPVVVEAAGRRVAFVAASSIAEHTLANWTATDARPGIASVRDLDRLLASVRTARAGADVVVVYMHWGIEGDRCPSSYQRSLARRLAEAGADAVVGTHAHLLQGAGHLPAGSRGDGGRGAYVAYGLGNFAFYTPPGTPKAESGVLTLTLAGREVTEARWTPARIDARGLPVPLRGAAAEQAREDWDALRRCTDLRP